MEKDIPITGITPEEWWRKRASLSVPNQGYRSVMSLSLTPEQSLQKTADSKKAFFTVLDRNLKPTDHILEVGTGIGRFTDDLATRAQKVTTIDYSIDMLHAAKSNIRLSNISMAQSDVVFLPFMDNSFDIYFEMTVFMHIVDTDLFNKAIQEAKRVVKNNGVIFLCSRLSPDQESHRRHFLLVHRPISEYEKALAPLVINERQNYTGKYTMIVAKNIK